MTSSVLRLLVWVSLVVLGVSACGPLSMLSGGSPAVSATAVGTQMAQEATQQLVVDQTTYETGGGNITVEELDKPVETGDVQKLTINNQEIPTLYLILLILGWLLPSPTEMGRGLMNMVSSVFPKKRSQ